MKLILVDPKQVDLSVFGKLPHLIMPPISEPRKAVKALSWGVKEMEKRYRSMAKFGARSLEQYNEIVGSLSTEERRLTEDEANQVNETKPESSFYCSDLPYIVVVVEEFADLMSVDKSNVEAVVIRLAQMARACGIHLILAMQSPRKDVITGMIKTNIPGRISFKVASKMDSRIILDDSGAERLLANGDMLFLAPGMNKSERHQGAWLPENDIQAVARFWSDQAAPEFDEKVMKILEGSGDGTGLDPLAEMDGDGFDEKYDEILAEVSKLKEVSASLLQRRYSIGYPRAARLIEIFEREGVVGPANGSKARQVLVSSFEADQ